MSPSLPFPQDNAEGRHLADPVLSVGRTPLALEHVLNKNRPQVPVLFFVDRREVFGLAMHRIRKGRQNPGFKSKVYEVLIYLGRISILSNLYCCLFQFSLRTGSGRPFFRVRPEPGERP